MEIVGYCMIHNKLIPWPFYNYRVHVSFVKCGAYLSSHSLARIYVYLHDPMLCMYNVQSQKCT